MNEGIVIQTNAKLVIETCCNCGVLFAMPLEMQEKKKREGGDFYCPNGHGQHYTQTTEMKLRHELDQAEARMERLVNEYDATARRLSAQKAQNTKLKKRIHAGVCPDCQRHFTNLEEHMKHEHGIQAEKQAVIRLHKEH